VISRAHNAKDPFQFFGRNLILFASDKKSQIEYFLFGNGLSVEDTETAQVNETESVIFFVDLIEDHPSNVVVNLHDVVLIDLDQIWVALDVGDLVLDGKFIPKNVNFIGPNFLIFVIDVISFLIEIVHGEHAFHLTSLYYHLEPAYQLRIVAQDLLAPNKLVRWHLSRLGQLGPHVFLGHNGTLVHLQEVLDAPIVNFLHSYFNSSLSPRRGLKVARRDLRLVVLRKLVVSLHPVLEVGLSYWISFVHQIRV